MRMRHMNSPSLFDVDHNIKVCVSPRRSDTATMIPSPNRFVIFSTRVQSRAVKARSMKNDFSRFNARRGHPQGRLSIQGLWAHPMAAR
jgi:hypothetical protein